VIGILLDAVGRASASTSTTTTTVPCSISRGGASITSVCTSTKLAAYLRCLQEHPAHPGPGHRALALLAISAVIPKRTRPGLYALLTTLIGGLALAASVWQWNDIGNHGASVTIDSRSSTTASRSSSWPWFQWPPSSAP